MATRGVKITGLNNLANNALTGNIIIPVVNAASTLSTPDGQTLQSNVSQIGNYILNAIAPNTTINLGPVSNVKITGGSNGQVLHTYGNGTLYWDVDDATFPGGPNTAVQFNDGGNFNGSVNFTFNKNSNTLDVTNIDVDNITIGNIQISNVGNGTSQQVLGIVNQDTQQLGWKTVPVYYITVDMRDGGNYLSSPDPVLRVYPVGQRDGSYLDLNVTQI